ncbi:MAG: HDIG domain-containing protein [Candidatus Bathyarchaeota archaeon]|nr:HDIG domain-containing protein [Candidatus Bathyarchaeota archaeon]
MSKTLPSREQALQILRENHCPNKVIDHCEAVTKLALETAKLLEKRGLKIDFALVEIGALLHDIGRSKTHTVHHAVVGAEIAKSVGLPDSVVSIIKRHVGGGIAASEAEELGWQEDVYFPITLEEKVVSYADKLIENGKRAPIDITVKKLSGELKYEAADRVRKLYEEILDLIGDCP